jgi:3'(2'), 5'-bisphosphate nucleotidase
MATTPLFSAAPELLASIINIAKTAGELISSIYSTDYMSSLKQDNTPLTQADLAAHEYITQTLTQLYPDCPILSEESSYINWEQRQHWQRYWLIDPLDGTKEFINRNGEFTVNIALIDDGVPLLGVVYAPELKLLFYAAEGYGSFCQKSNATPYRIQTKPYQFTRMTDNQNTGQTTQMIKGQEQDSEIKNKSNTLKIVASRSHPSPLLAAFLNQFDAYELVNLGSSLKLCLVASGEAHLYPRLGPTSEWDTAAAHCIVEQAGGIVVDTHLQPLRYNQKSSLINPSFIVAASKEDLSSLQPFPLFFAE